MLTTRDEILARLDALGIEHKTVLHPPVFTVEEAQLHTRHIPGGHCKNLFLKDKKDRLWLVTCLDEQPVDLNRLSKLLGAARFSFGRPELLAQTLGVAPGSVTPLAIVNDAAGTVTARARHQAAWPRLGELPSAAERRHDQPAQRRSPALRARHRPRAGADRPR